MDQIIINQLITNKEYIQKSIPYLKKDYFSSYNEKIVFDIINKYYQKYGNCPTTSIIQVALTNSKTIREETFTQVSELLDDIKEINDDFDLKWLIDNTETWAQDRALENAVIDSVEIMKDEKQNRGKIQELITKALEVNFNSTIGIEFFNSKDINKRWEYYHSDNTKFPTGIKKLDTVLNGGLIKKTLSCLLCPTHGGKTAAKIAIASNFIRNGYDVLYVTLEMSESEISKRFEANFLNVPINNIDSMEEKKFKSTLLNLKQKSYGKLIIKEFPPVSITANHIKSLLNELQTKKKFRPTLICIDYLNLLLSSRVKEGNSYSIVKAISEEVRGLGVEDDYILLSSTQTNRGGHSSSDLQVEDTGESYGLPQTVDLLIAIITNEELREQNIQIWKSLKNRMSGIIDFKFPIKTAFEYCKLLDMDNGHEQELNLVNNEKAKMLMEKVKNNKKKKKLKISVDEDTVKNEIAELLN